MIQGGNESVASAWVLIIPILWPAPPHPPFIPKHSSGMGRRVGCLSLGIDLPPFYGPLLCFTDPPLSLLPIRVVWARVLRRRFSFSFLRPGSQDPRPRGLVGGCVIEFIS